MGRFVTTVPLYENFRSPYAAGFFETVARRAEARRRRIASSFLAPGPNHRSGLHRLCQPHRSRRPEPAMLEAARQAAGRTSQLSRYWKARPKRWQPTWNI